MNQNLQKEIMALVQAAMNGDEKASQQIESIMKAAQQGNPQATQIAQMIEQVAKQLQQQAVSAKFGSKLKYIKSIKAAKGCKMRKVRKHQNGGSNWYDYGVGDWVPGLATAKSIGRAATGNGTWGDVALTAVGDILTVVPGGQLVGTGVKTTRAGLKLANAVSKGASKQAIKEAAEGVSKAAAKRPSMWSAVQGLGSYGISRGAVYGNRPNTDYYVTPVDNLDTSGYMYTPEQLNSDSLDTWDSTKVYRPTKK